MPSRRRPAAGMLAMVCTGCVARSTRSMFWRFEISACAFKRSTFSVGGIRGGSACSVGSAMKSTCSKTSRSVRCHSARRRESGTILRGVGDAADGDDGFGAGADAELRGVFAIADPGAGGGDGVAVLVRLLPFRAKGVAERNDLEAGARERVIHGAVDPAVGAAECEPADLDDLGRGDGGDGGAYRAANPFCEKVHALRDAGDVLGERADGIEMLRLDRKDAVERDEAEGGLQTDDAATGRGHADGAGGVRAEGDVGLAGGDGICGAARGAAGNQFAPAAERISGRAEVVVDAGGRDGEFAEVHLADDDDDVALPRDGRGTRHRARPAGRFWRSIRSRRW